MFGKYVVLGVFLKSGESEFVFASQWVDARNGCAQEAPKMLVNLH